ncbi:hypothetical protein MMC17_005177 [Xylographa soralifera]|nr:hypothetical protein [Xylographa soralifera]
MASPQATTISMPVVVLANSDKAGTTSSTTSDSVLPTRAVPPATSTPAGFKIVKVRKPDGTVVKVRRPIKPDADSPAPSTTAPQMSTTVPRQALTEKPSKSATPKIEPEAHSEQQIGLQETVPAGQAPALVSTQSKTSESQLIPKPHSTGKGQPTDAANIASRLATPAKTYRLYRTMHKMHRNFSRTIGAFDSSGDMSDADDGISNMESGDDEIDDGSHTPSSDDDSDDDTNDNDRNQEKNSGTHGKSDSGSNTLPLAHTTGHSTTNSSTFTPRRIKPDIQTSTREANGTSDKGTKSEIQINEKEIQPDTTIKVQSHQHTPRNLKRRSTMSQYIIWGIMITFPLLYIILGILTASQTGTPVGSTIGSNVHIAIPFAVTAWPIIFAAVAAQSLKILATYKVERGLRLMTLEQLISSHSVAGAIKQPFLLRRLDWISIALLFLWSSSPLASQAMQHMAITGSSTITNTAPISYVNTTGTNIVFGNYAASSNSGQQLLQFQTEVDALYTASFVAPNYVQYSSQDL